MANPIGSPELFSSQFKRYTLPSYLILNSDESRLDASHYNPDVFNAINILKESGMRLERLEDIVDRVFIPPRFKRIYVSTLR